MILTVPVHLQTVDLIAPSVLFTRRSALTQLVPSGFLLRISWSRIGLVRHSTTDPSPSLLVLPLASIVHFFPYRPTSTAAVLTRRLATGQRASSPLPSLGHRALTDGGLQSPVRGTLLPAEEPSHRRRFAARDRCGLLSPVLATEYIAQPWVSFDAERFRAISIRRAICAHTPNGPTTVQQIQEKGWAGRCRHSTNR